MAKGAVNMNDFLIFFAPLGVLQYVDAIGVKKTLHPGCITPTRYDAGAMRPVDTLARDDEIGSGRIAR
jgi:hypothetical protein